MIEGPALVAFATRLGIRYLTVTTKDSCLWLTEREQERAEKRGKRMSVPKPVQSEPAQPEAIKIVYHAAPPLPHRSWFAKMFQERPEQPDNDMQFACPCGEVLLIEKQYVGCEVHCPVCGQKVTVPNAESSDARGAHSLRRFVGTPKNP